MFKINLSIIENINEERDQVTFKVSEKNISKRKRVPIYHFIFILLILSPFLYKEDGVIDVAIIGTFIIIMIIPMPFSLYLMATEVKGMRLLSVEISSEGIKTDNTCEHSILPIEKIKEISIKEKQNNISKILIKTILNEQHDYSIYENLNQFNDELKNVLDNNLWIKK